MTNKHDSASQTGEPASERRSPGEAKYLDQTAPDTRASLEVCGVVGGSRSGKGSVVKAGELPGQEVVNPEGAQHPAEVRAAIVALKPGNAGGAKGGRKANEPGRTTREATLSEVSLLAGKQEREDPWEEEDLWQAYRAEPGVWSRRMLRALQEGVKGKKWFSLIDKVYQEKTLQLAWEKVQRNAGACGVDGITVARFEKDSQTHLLDVKEHLQKQSYQPKPVKRVWIAKDGSRTQKRPLGIPTVRDRVVQSALKMVIEPIFEREFAEQSYGFRPGRGCKDALRRVEELLKSGYLHVVDADVKAYFDSIPFEGLISLVEEQVADGRVIALIEQMLHQGVLEGLSYWEPEEGTPQGAVISPLLANLYLNPLDWLMKQAGFEMVRYADDFVVLTRSCEEAERGLELVREWVMKAGLELHPEKTRLVNLEQGGEYFDFLGYRFVRSKKGKLTRVARPKSEKKLRRGLKPLTRRCSGRGLKATIEKINPILRGWFGYFKHAPHWQLAGIDGWVRGRLRGILRKRRKGRGRGRGLDHQRWPNRYFESLGLYSLADAREEAYLSLRAGAKR